MIDFQTATSYLKQCIEQLELKEDELHRQSLDLEAKQRKLIQERADLIALKSSFHEQSGAMTAKIEKANKLHELALKMKKQLDDERAAFKLHTQLKDKTDV